MTEQATVASVRASILVRATPEHAFETFTDMTAWWPRKEHQLSEKPLAGVIIEPRAGGRWFERDVDGGECDWGFVTAWEPPARVLLAWHLGPDWKFNPDPAKATEIEVRFTPQDDGTLVELEHRGFEVHGPAGARMRDEVAGGGGWGRILEERYVPAANARR
jgi:hypothetical protein